MRCVCVCVCRRRVYPYSVEVLVEAIQQEGQKLLGVVLLVAQELRGKVAHLRLHTHKEVRGQGGAFYYGVTFT